MEGVYVVGAGWPSAAGQDMPTDFRMPFGVGDALRDRPDLGDWAVTPPRIGTRMPLIVRLDRLYDRVQLPHSIALRNANGQQLPGRVQVQDNGTVWQFVPQDPWADRDITLVVDAVLEDVAGNNFREVLDHAVGTRSRQLDHVTLNVTLID